MARKERLTEEQLNTRLRFVIGVVLAAVLAGTMGSVLYSLIYVTQPMSSHRKIKHFLI